MKIAIDFDSVLSDTMVSWTQKFNEKYDKDFTKADVKKWTFWDDFDISHDAAKEIFREAWEDWENLQPTEDNLSTTTQELSELGDIDIVTNVEFSYRKYVQSWLEKNRIVYQNLVNNSKKEELSYNVFIDDDPDLATTLSIAHKNCLVYHQQWNSHITEGKYIKRIQNLKESRDKIKSKI